jgi:hypothetical protein
MCWIFCLFISLLLVKIQLSRGRLEISLTCLTPPISSQDLEIQRICGGDFLLLFDYLI